MADGIHWSTWARIKLVQWLSFNWFVVVACLIWVAAPAFCFFQRFIEGLNVVAICTLLIVCDSKLGALVAMWRDEDLRMPNTRSGPLWTTVTQSSPPRERVGVIIMAIGQLIPKDWVLQLLFVFVNSNNRNRSLPRP